LRIFGRPQQTIEARTVAPSIFVPGGVPRTGGERGNRGLGGSDHKVLPK